MNKRLYILASSLLLAIAITGVALGSGEGTALLGGTRNPGSNQSQALNRETQIIANTGTYGTRQSNKSDNGGGAIYGCRSGAGGSPKGNEPCIRSNNLSKGFAFEFETNGNLGGTINAEGGDKARPFTTNATGVATGLNADRVDNMNAQDIIKAAQSPNQAADPYIQVASNGSVVGSRGIVATNPVVRTGAGDRKVTFTGDQSKCAFTTGLESANPGTISIQTTLASDKKTTTVEVKTYSFAAAGPVPADLAFHLAATC